MSRFRVEVTSEGSLSLREKSGSGFYVRAASFKGINVPVGVTTKEVLIELPRESKQEFMFIQAPATTEDAEIIVLEWAERWLDDDTKVAGTVTVSVPFANLDLPKNFRPRKKKMYSISEDAIYLRVGQSFYCSNEAKARARELRYAPAETMIKYILGWITLADLGMIARGADKKEVEGLRRENKGLRKSLDEARKQARKFLDEKTALEDELRSTTFSLKVMLGQNEDTLDILKKHWDILGDIRRVAGETEKVPFWQKGRSHDKLELIRGRLERAAAEDKI